MPPPGFNIREIFHTRLSHFLHKLSKHDRPRRLGKLLRYRRLVCRCADWVAVCRHDADCAMPASGSDAQAGDAFATPNVVHFGVVLLLSTIVSAPWQKIAIVAVLWGILGLVGVVYALVVAKRMRSQTAYRPVFEDWLFHALLPL